MAKPQSKKSSPKRPVNISLTESQVNRYRKQALADKRTLSNWVGVVCDKACDRAEEEAEEMVP